MKWMLVVMVFGSAPVKTGLLYSSLDECLKAEFSVRAEYTAAYNNWLKWAQANPGESGFPGTKAHQIRRVGLESPGACIPHKDDAIK